MVSGLPLQGEQSRKGFSRVLFVKQPFRRSDLQSTLALDHVTTPEIKGTTRGKQHHRCGRDHLKEALFNFPMPARDLLVSAASKPHYRNAAGSPPVVIQEKSGRLPGVASAVGGTERVSRRRRC